MKESIKISAKESLGLYERKQHKTWFEEKCSEFLDQRKQAKMQWLHTPNQSNVDNLNNARREGTKRRNIRKLKLMNLKQTIRTRISETCIVAPMT
jgi:hypothetical protein